MNNYKLVEPTGFIVAGITLLLSLLLFYSDTKSFLGSFSAALMAAGLIWISYVIVRMLVLAFKR